MYLVGGERLRSEGMALSSFRWKCDSKFGVDSATNSPRSGLNTVTALLAIPYSSSVAGGNARVQELSTESSGFSCRGIGPNREGK